MFEPSSVVDIDSLKYFPGQWGASAQVGRALAPPVCRDDLFK
jgi:hypothetical protein